MTDPAFAYSPSATAVYFTLLWVGICADWACAFASMRRRLYKKFSILFLYLIYTAVGDLIGLLLTVSGHTTLDWRFFLLFSCTGYCLEAVVGFELIYDLFKVSGIPVYASSLMRFYILSVFFFIAISICLSGVILYRHVTPSVGVFARLELADGLCRVLLFAVFLLIARLLRIQTSSWSFLTMGYLGLYFTLTLGCQILHEVHGNHFFIVIEGLRVLIVTATMLVLARHILSLERAEGMATIEPVAAFKARQ